jgi:hypothetical protein
MRPSARLLWLAAYALGMALVEAAIVVHLRQLYYPADPRMLFPLNLLTPDDLRLEIARELATILMIASVAILSERGFMRVFAAFVYVFGLWDLGYYAWLRIFLDWPRSWLEWDVLFLIPWPWLGPWLAAAGVALLFTFWGGWTIGTTTERRLHRDAALLFVSGTLLVLTAFLAPGWPLLSAGADAWRVFLPERFCWELYLPGLALMGVGLLLANRRARGRMRAPAHPPPS